LERDFKRREDELASRFTNVIHALQKEILKIKTSGGLVDSLQESHASILAQELLPQLGQDLPTSDKIKWV
jgi:hypothetical protein